MEVTGGVPAEAEIEMGEGDLVRAVAVTDLDEG